MYYFRVLIPEDRVDLLCSISIYIIFQLVLGKGLLVLSYLFLHLYTSCFYITFIINYFIRITQNKYCLTLIVLY